MSTPAPDGLDWAVRPMSLAGAVQFIGLIRDVDRKPRVCTVESTHGRNRDEPVLESVSPFAGGLSLRRRSSSPASAFDSPEAAWWIDVTLPVHAALLKNLHCHVPDRLVDARR